MKNFWKLANRISQVFGVHPPPGPAGGLWSWQYLDIFKTARMVMSKRVKDLYRAFPDQHPPGSQFPHIVLETTDGRTIDTASLIGQKHLVLFTGAIT